MEITKTLYIKDRAEWRKWLAKNYKKEKEIWLICYKKGSDKETLNYNDSVEEALCFGWIDSIVKSLNHESFAQRFSPRKANSNFSQTNIERLKKLIKQKKVSKEVLEPLKEIKPELF